MEEAAAFGWEREISTVTTASPGIDSVHIHINRFKENNSNSSQNMQFHVTGLQTV